MAEAAKGGNGTETPAPDALVKRRVKVDLSDGSSVTVEKWSWSKKASLIVLIGNLENLPTIVEASLAPDDRGRVPMLLDEDMVKIYDESLKLNVTLGLAKNVRGLYQTLAELVETIETKSP